MVPRKGPNLQTESCALILLVEVRDSNELPSDLDVNHFTWYHAKGQTYRQKAAMQLGTCSGFMHVYLPALLGASRSMREGVVAASESGVLLAYFRLVGYAHLYRLDDTSLN